MPAQTDFHLLLHNEFERQGLVPVKGMVFDQSGGLISLTAVPAEGGQSGAGSPVGVKTPDFENQLYHDTVADVFWRSTGLTSADWSEISGGGSSSGLLTLSGDLILTS